MMQKIVTSNTDLDAQASWSFIKLQTFLSEWLISI